MKKDHEVCTSPYVNSTVSRLTILFAALLLSTASPAQPRVPNGAGPLATSPSVNVSENRNTPASGLTIPAGTILPIRLNTTLSSKCKAGQVISGRIMQDVPLSPGQKIKAGSKVTGHIVEVTPVSTGAKTRISLQFDKVISAGQEISIVTNLRAVTGFMGVRAAETPSEGPGESDNVYQFPTIQVGGDVAYGVGGVVTTGENSNDVVGKELTHGVLGQVRANEVAKCRGPIDGNNRPQALWVFSSNACGVYDLEHISITHAGRTDPTGVIVLEADSGKLNLRAGAGMLLRVN